MYYPTAKKNGVIVENKVEVLNNKGFYVINYISSLKGDDQKYFYETLLPIVDDFERAIKANENLSDMEVMKDGFNLIYNKLLNMLKRFDVTEIEAKGEVFDTDLHEAVTHFPTPNEEEKGKVIDVTEKGYKIKDKVIRYAKVVVGQ